LPLFSRRFESWIDPADVFVTLYSKDEFAFWLDREAHPVARQTIMGHAHRALQVDLQEVLATSTDSAAKGYEASATAESSLPFAWRPGYIGWFDYRPLGLPGVVPTGFWVEAREAIVFDHDTRQMWLCGNFNDAEHFDEWVRALLLRLALSGGQSTGYQQRNPMKTNSELISMAHTPAEYRELIVRAQRHIAAGDVYQLCLTNQLRFEHELNPLAVFLRLRQQNSAPYANYLRMGSTTLVGSSPEQFLTVTPDGLVTTRPIKGTRPRHQDPEVDSEIADQLAHDPKERAENLMIVDLMRNDLGRVSDPESVAVTKLFEVEQHPTVHQLVSTITARLQSDVGISDLLHATFPAGSMTGAPKLRAMELISELEAVARGTYSGVSGFIGSNGAIDLGMTIRSLVFSGNVVSLGVGGGITIDSDPDAEVAETALKAQALLRVINAASPW